MSTISILESTLTDGSPVYDVTVDGDVVHYASSEAEARTVCAELSHLDAILNNAPLGLALRLAVIVERAAVRPEGYRYTN